MQIDTNKCAILKECQSLVKAVTVSVRSSKKHQQVRFTAFNENTNILLYHQIDAKVEEDQKFAVATERLIALLCRKDVKIELKFNGNSLEYKYRRSKGIVETFGFETHENPQIKRDKSLTKSLKQNSKFLSLKTVIENVGNFIFIEEGKDSYLAAADAGAYHAVLIKNPNAGQEESNLTLPQEHVQNALRALKENIQICSVGENLFCFTESEDGHTKSIIRFRNMVETNIKMDVIKRAVNAENAVEFPIESTAFDDILADYKTIEDKDKGGVIKIDVDENTVKMTCQTRHGKNSLDVPVKTKEKFSFSVSTKLLVDILRFTGLTKLAIKKDMNIMTLTQQGKETEITFMCSIEKHV